MLGVFMALDLLLFFVFWEVGLVPMYFLINQWGGATRNYASLKFILYTMGGSLGLLLAIQMIGVVTGTFDLTVLISTWPGLQEATLLGAADRNGQSHCLLGFCDCLCDQGAGLAVPHLAAGCPHRSAHGRFDDPGGCAAQAGRLRLSAPGAAALPGAKRTSTPAGWRRWVRWRSSLGRWRPMGRRISSAWWPIPRSTTWALWCWASPRRPGRWAARIAWTPKLPSTVRCCKCSTTASPRPACSSWSA